MLPKKKNESTAIANENEQAAPAAFSQTVLAEGVLFKGDFEAGEPMLVYGKIEGNIKSTSDVVLSSTSSFTGNLEAENTTISGVAKGDIHCRNVARMEEKGEIKGDVNTGRFIMSEDATFTGKLTVKKQD